MNTIEELLNSKKTEVEEEKPKENVLEKKVLKNKERKERKLDQDYKELTQLENKTWLKILVFACPFIGTVLGVFWSLFQLGVDKETAAADACKIEHDISDITFSCLKKHFGYNG